MAACGGGNPAQTRPAALNARETALDPQEQIHIAISAKLNDPKGLEDYIAQMQDPDSANFRKTLTPASIRDRFGPTEGQINGLTGFLRAKGFQNITVSENRLLVEADVTSAVAEKVFATRLKKFIRPDGTSGHKNDVKPSIPSEVANFVTAIYGLDTMTQFQTHRITATTAAQASTAAMPSGTVMGHNPLDFPGIYNAGSTSTASNITVGIITWGDPSPSVNDLRLFEQQNGLPATSASITVVGNASSYTGDTAEWSLDSQAIVGMSGGVKKLKFYTAQSATMVYVLQAVNAAIQDADRPQVINMSFGACESSGLDSADYYYFAVGAAQGQTFVASSGDTGSDCPSGPNLIPNTTQYPASAKYVVNVGGTTLGTVGARSYSGETAWSGSGGGVSKYTSIPFWQAIVPSLAGTQYRSGPDVSFVGDPASGALVVVNGAPKQYGGTSLSAPLFAATWARLLQSCGSNLGFAGATLYQFANKNPNMYRDITLGSNGGYSAAPGWDKVTGWGSVNMDNMRAAICPGSAYTAMTQALYLAYVGRPADPSGLAYYAIQMKNANLPTTWNAFASLYGSNATVTNIVNAFAASPESQALYPSDVTAYVTQVYWVLFHRAPDPGGLSYWTGLINSGLPRQYVPLGMMNGALVTANSDGWVAGNKIAVAMNFTSTLTTTQSAYYSGNMAVASGRHLLDGVTYNNDSFETGIFWKQPTYVSSYQSSVNAAIAAIVAGIPF